MTNNYIEINILYRYYVYNIAIQVIGSLLTTFLRRKEDRGVCRIARHFRIQQMPDGPP
jgi:hypothetical protein